jgi:hypothetical protein
MSFLPKLKPKFHRSFDTGALGRVQSREHSEATSRRREKCEALFAVINVLNG